MQLTKPSIFTTLFTFSNPISFLITDKIVMNYILKNYQFSEVFHTAAYKHVNLLETNSYEAIYNNLIGTKILIEALKDKCKKLHMLI